MVRKITSTGILTIILLSLFPTVLIYYAILDRIQLYSHDQPTSDLISKPQSQSQPQEDGQLTEIANIHSKQNSINATCQCPQPPPNPATSPPPPKTTSTSPTNTKKPPRIIHFNGHHGVRTNLNWILKHLNPPLHATSLSEMDSDIAKFYCDVADVVITGDVLPYARELLNRVARGECQNVKVVVELTNRFD
ncbi:hypothetical protein HDU76_004635, partial [Blyttiomyces sp. JEL0837]